MFIFWVFLTIAILGAIALIAMAVLGDFFHIGGADVDVGGDIGPAGPDFETSAGPSPLGAPIMVFSITMMGVIGAIMTYVGVSWYISLIVAIGGALVVAFVAYLIFARMFKQYSSDAHEDIRRFKGRTGIVTVKISAGKEGQVVFSSDKSGRFTVGATSDVDIPVDSIVVVTEIIGDIVEVRPRAKSKSKNNESEVKKKAYDKEKKKGKKGKK